MAAIAQQAQPEVDIDQYAGRAGGETADSVYDSELASYTTSLDSRVTDYKFQGGRRYHAYKEGSYPFPNDDKENDRLDMMSQMIRVALHGQLFSAPIKNPKRILDVGTGTGLWAIEMADKFPEAYILGNDLSPVQPRWVPENVHFDVDDVEQEWTYTSKFDLIHVRTLYAAISDWPRLVSQCYEFTAPGGYAEFTDLDSQLLSPDNSIPEDAAIALQNREVMKVCHAMGKEPAPGRYLEKWVRDAGFEEVTVKKIPLPFGTWPKSKHLKEVGSWNFLQTYEGIEAYCTQLFMNGLGWSKEQVDALCSKIRSELKDPNLHGMITLYNVYGRKPADKATTVKS